MINYNSVLDKIEDWTIAQVKRWFKGLPKGEQEELSLQVMYYDKTKLELLKMNTRFVNCGRHITRKPNLSEIEGDYDN